MNAFFSERKESILSWLRSYLDEKSAELSGINRYGIDVPGRLLDFISNGKMIRGGLVSLFEGVYSGTVTENSVIAGSAMELFQAALLIHDDIMDQDEVRRGRASVHCQYGAMAEEAGMNDPGHTGVSLGICAGDASFFLGFEALHLISAAPGVMEKIIRLCSREMTAVSIAQMQDIENGASADIQPAESVLRLYMHKTGRYTFSLPMTAGALLGGASDGDLNLLSGLGEQLGIIFQLKDDELGLFGDEEAIGKPVGSDISEGKQTMFYLKLREMLTGPDREELLALFGKKDLSSDDIGRIRRAVIDFGVKKEIDGMLERLIDGVRREINKIPKENAAFRSILDYFIEYNLKRTI